MGCIVHVDDRSGGTLRMPGNPWRFSAATLPPPGVPAFQGEHNVELLTERNVDPAHIQQLQERQVLLSRKSLRESLMRLDRTHDRAARSWLYSANDVDSHFPLQNLPYRDLPAPNE